MANIKSIDTAGDKWRRRAAVATPDYSAGIDSPRVAWDQASMAGAANYKTGVTAAATSGRFEKGIRAAGNAKWQQNTKAKGPTRYAEGVALSVDEWQRGFTPYHAAIGSLQLPPRGPKGSPQNMQRVTAVTAALRQVRERAGA